jgi:hypothetical protein
VLSPPLPRCQAGEHYDGPLDVTEDEPSDGAPVTIDNPDIAVPVNAFAGALMKPCEPRRRRGFAASATRADGSQDNRRARGPKVLPAPFKCDRRGGVPEPVQVACIPPG